MGFREGQRIVRAITDFTKSGLCHPERGTIIQLCNTLQKRKFGERHFEQAHDYFEQLRAAAPVKVIDSYRYDPTAPLGEKEISLFLSSMGLRLNKKGNPMPDKYTPTLIKAVMRQDLLSFSNRQLPLFFSSQHIEERFEERAERPMVYDDTEFQWTLITGLLFAITHPQIMRENEENTGMAPVVLPSSDGLYFGHTTRCALESYYPGEFILSAHAGVDNKPVLHGLQPDMRIITKPDWTPSSYLTLHTFVDCDNFKPDQAELYPALRAALNTPNIASVYTSLINSYAHCGPLADDDLANLDSVVNALGDVMRTPLWDEVCSHGKRHVPKVAPNTPPNTPASGP